VSSGRRVATGSPKPWLIAGCRAFGAGLSRCVFRMQVQGLHHVPRAGPVLLAGNHTGLLDGPLVFLLAPRPAVFLAKAELFTGVLARALGWLGQVPVHRGQPDRAALKLGLAHLAAGGALGVFPEGSRGTGDLDQITHGLAYLALRSGAPVVPLAVLGTAAALPKGRRVPVWRAPVRVVFGAPVELSVTGDPRARRTVATAAEQLHVALLAHLRSARARGSSDQQHG